MSAQSNAGHAPMISAQRHRDRSATRFSCNRDWSRRGDNTKYRKGK